MKPGPKVQKEFQGWTAQQDLSDHLVFLVQKETVELQVGLASQVWGLQVLPAQLDLRGRKVPRDHQENRVCPVPPDLRAHLEPLT